MSKLENKILDALEEIRPFLVKDGGDISLESVQNSTVKTLNKIFKDCNIEVKKIISHQYSSSFAEKSDISPCIAGKKVTDGINPSEVMMHNPYTKKQGLFEKMFNFFS